MQVLIFGRDLGDFDELVIENVFGDILNNLADRSVG